MKCRVTVLPSNYAPSHSDDRRLCKFLSHCVHIEKGDGWIFGLIDEVSHCCFRNWRGSVKSKQ